MDGRATPARTTFRGKTARLSRGGLVPLGFKFGTSSSCVIETQSTAKVLANAHLSPSETSPAWWLTGPGTLHSYETAALSALVRGGGRECQPRSGKRREIVSNVM